MIWNSLLGELTVLNITSVYINNEKHILNKLSKEQKLG